ncbi:MAG: penicillin-binding protein 2 [Anaerolineales bacterium]|nr:penicillin-binding protein 2 [Anaerolineales bacterium]
MTSSVSDNKFHFSFWRLTLFYVVIFITFTVLLSRLVTLQVIEGETWTDQAVENFTRAISVPASRGIIYDRNGYILARNDASYNVVIVPANLPDDDADIQRIYREVSAITGVPVNSGTLEEAKLFAECVEGPGITQLVELGDSLAPYSAVKVKCNVSQDVARLVSERTMDWPGVSIEIEPMRDYPTGSLTANVVGFLGPIPANLEDEYRNLGFVPRRDKVGYSGVELSLQDVLSGRNGRRVVQVDVAGKEIRNIQAPVSAIPGSNIVLTIDTRLQAAAEAALLGEINFWNTYFGEVRISSGVVIAINPQNGEILAMVTYPTYENNRMARFIPAYYYEQLSQDPRHPLLNNAISGEYPPGSVFKLSTANGALNEGVVTINQVIDTPGQLVLTEKFSPSDPGLERPFVDWIYDDNPDGFGQLTFKYCIAYSSNVCFYKLGGGTASLAQGNREEIPEGLNIQPLYEYARALGYAQPSGIELPGEGNGLIPSPQWKRINKGENWSTGDTYIASVGQGYVLATPLQVIMSGATMANDGKLMQPTIVHEIIDENSKVVEKWFNSEDFTITNAPTDLDVSYQISPSIPNLKWDITETPVIKDYDCEGGYCEETGEYKTVDPFVVRSIQEGMRLAVTDSQGTLYKIFSDFPVAVAGKTGTAEYCDDVALANNRCQYGAWPTHSWTLAYAPYEDPEVVIAAFLYNGGEGASVAGPVVGLVMDAYFEIKSIDIARGVEGN